MSHFITCDSAAIDFDLIIHRLRAKLTLMMGRNKLILMSIIQSFVAFSGKSTYLEYTSQVYYCTKKKIQEFLSLIFLSVRVRAIMRPTLFTNNQICSHKQ